MLSDPEDLGIVLAFLERFTEDRDAGVQRSLAEYQGMFPEHGALIAREFERMNAGRHDATPEDAMRQERTRIGSFEVHEEIGRGGQAVVYLAEDTRLRRRVALKVFRSSPLEAETMGLRFRREAEATSRLNHPGICPVYEAGNDGDLAYIAMAWVDGETLASKIEAARERKENGERRPCVLDVPQEGEPGGHAAVSTTTSELRAVMLLIERVARSLHVAHEAGVVHRDVKPGNIMIPADGGPVLLDFGLAWDEESQLGTVTMDGDVFGTPAYMSPEQVQPELGRVDRRSDVYSLGVTLYEALTLRRPFEAPTREGLYRAILSERPADPARLCKGLSRDLSVVLTTALEKDPDRRYLSALDLAEDLRRVRELEPIAARPVGRLVRLGRWIQRNPALAGALAGVFAVLVAGLCVALHLLGRANRALLDTRILSDLRAIPYLVEQADEELWPVLPDRAAAMRRWLDEAQALLGRVPEYRGLSADAKALGWDARHAALLEFLAGVASLERTVADVRDRERSASGLRKLTIDEHRGDWDRARREIRESVVYRGLDLEPQVGLVPLGPDPASGLQEFAHHQSGGAPARAGDGRLRLGEEHGVVFVLLPGGSAWIGSQSTDEAAPNFDPTPYTRSHRLKKRDVDAFFLSKFEMTQAQWLRLGGVNPSYHAAGSEGPLGRATLLHPVEMVSWNEAHLQLSRYGLVLPRSVEWEYACRAGTTTPWHPGSEIESLEGYGNFLDRSILRARGSWSVIAREWTVDVDFDDGHALTSRVGSFLANGFGLHDMHGNVAELCADRFGHLRRFCVVRGGAYRHTALLARSAEAGDTSRQERRHTIGVRPARRIDP